MTNIVLLSTIFTTNCGMLHITGDGFVTQDCEVYRMSQLGYRDGTNVVSVGWIYTTNGAFSKGYDPLPGVAGVKLK